MLCTNDFSAPNTVHDSIEIFQHSPNSRFAFATEFCRSTYLRGENSKDLYLGNNFDAFCCILSILLSVVLEVAVVVASN
jgi:hypothetical protein